MKETTMKKYFSMVAVLAAITIFPTAGVAGDLVVETPWARATISVAKTAAAYLTIKNGGSAPDRLVGARSDVAKKTGIHRSLKEGGIMKMRPVQALDVPAGGTVMLRPGGYHIMFMGLKAPFKMGHKFPLTLVFEKAGEIEVTVKVMKAGAMDGMNMKMKHAE